MSTGDYLDPATRGRVQRHLEQLQDELRGICGPEPIERHAAEPAGGRANSKEPS